MSESLSELLRARFGDSPEVPANLEDNGVLKQIAEHCSHRSFTEEPVDEQVLQTLFYCALSAPSKSDLQQVGVFRVQDRDLREQIAALIPSMPWIGTAPEFLIFAGDNRRIRRICEARGKPFANDHLDSFFNASVDGALAMMNFITAAQAAGLGCCPVSAVRIHARAISDLLEMPSWVFPIAGLALGHPIYGPRITPRLAPCASVHTNAYEDESLLGDLDEYDHRRDERMPVPASKQRLVGQYGDSEFYGWSEDKARQVSTPERQDFGDYATEQGFKLK